MSGGSWEYLCYKVQDAAFKLCQSNNAQRKAFGKHLALVAEALHDIEWVDSCDKSPGDEFKSIMKCIKNQDVLNSSVDDAKDMIKRLEDIIEAINKGEK